MLFFNSYFPPHPIWKFYKSVVSQNVIPSKKYFGGAKPFAFTETGVAMLLSVLRSKKVVEIVFTLILLQTIILFTLILLHNFSEFALTLFQT